MMRYRDLKKDILTKLELELPKKYSYHSIFHVKDVLNACIAIGRLEKVKSDDLILLKTAALFHDSGFIYGPANHEEKSCEIAREILPDYSYASHQIEKICGMIRATKIPQNPKNHLEEILADADLDYLGRDDFFEIATLLYQELLISGTIQNETEWNKLQVKFFENHHYFTKTSEKLRNKGKEKNLLSIKAKLHLL